MAASAVRCTTAHWFSANTKDLPAGRPMGAPTDSYERQQGCLPMRARCADSRFFRCNARYRSCTAPPSYTVGAASGRLCGKVYHCASVFGEYEIFPCQAPQWAPLRIFTNVRRTLTGGKLSDFRLVVSRRRDHKMLLSAKNRPGFSPKNFFQQPLCGTKTCVIIEKTR